jgi:hypothetical protein
MKNIRKELGCHAHTFELEVSNTFTFLVGDFKYDFAVTRICIFDRLPAGNIAVAAVDMGAKTFELVHG